MLSACYAALAFLSIAAQPPQDDAEAVLEQVMRAAVARVAPSVVQIETSGGTEMIGAGGQGPQVRQGTGPTTGLVVAADGYIISSAFNFANKPAAIFVAIPGHKDRLVAKTVATDQTRMLTLLKVEASGLPVPTAAPKKEIRVGQWALALGRTWAKPDTPPSVSVGIASALGRIWGKALQTDAKVSPTNYGGPLIDLQGQVLGVLVPASPRGQDETAGVEWYDSGIGFAIPLEDIFAVLPRLKEGKDLKKGLLGIALQTTDIYAATPVIGTVAPDSAAARAGIKPGDTILAISGVPVVRQAQILHLLGDKYEADIVSVKVRRGKEELSFDKVRLSGDLSESMPSFLGILPMRDDPEPGEEVRYVFPKSPAEAAGLKPGDRIVRAGLGEGPMRNLPGRAQLSTLLDRLSPGSEMRVEVKRKDGKKTETLKLTLGVVTDALPDNLPQPATRKKALEQPRGTPVLSPGAPREPQAPKKPEAKPKPAETGLLKRTTPAGDHDYWLYIPPDYDPNISYALVVWLHPAGGRKERDQETEALIAAWEPSCKANHLILLCPRAEGEASWLASEADFVEQTIREVRDSYTIDHHRVLTHGLGVGGQMACYLGFNARDLIHGVAAVGAAPGNLPKETLTAQRLAFFLVAGGKDPQLPAIREGKARLVEHHFPVTYREVSGMGHQYLDADALRELVRWIDALDRQ
jgi:S1-C subfamily serine protease/predicted esterase